MATSLAEALPLDELHGDPGVAVVLADLVDRDDVRVVEGRGGARLVLEALEVLAALREPLGEQLDGDLAPEPGVAGAKDATHAAGAELAEDLESRDVVSGLHEAPGHAPTAGGGPVRTGLNIPES